MKKILAVLLSLLMLMMSMAVYATETEHIHEGCCCGEETVEVASEIQPRANICKCGATMTRSVITRTSQEARACSHGAAAGTDVYSVKKYYYADECPACNNYVETWYKSVDTLIYCPRGV